MAHGSMISGIRAYTTYMHNYSVKQLLYTMEQTLVGTNAGWNKRSDLRAFFSSCDMTLVGVVCCLATGQSDTDVVAGVKNMSSSFSSSEPNRPPPDLLTAAAAVKVQKKKEEKYIKYIKHIKFIKYIVKKKKNDPRPSMTYLAQASCSQLEV